LDRPDDIETIQLVAILRALKKTQDDVADILEIRKARIVQIENWLKNAPLDSVAGIFDDYQLKKIINKKLVDNTNLNPYDLVQAGRLTTEDILQHHPKDYSPKTPKESEQINPEIQKALEEHQNEIRQLIQEWNNSLTIPIMKDVSVDMPSPIKSVKANPLFDSLKHHIPDKSLWDNHSTWDKNMDDYLSTINQLRNEMASTIAKWKYVRQVYHNVAPPWRIERYDKDVAQPLLSRIGDKVSGKTPRPWEAEWVLTKLVIDGYMVLQADYSSFNSIEESYKDYANSLLDGANTDKLVQLFKKLTESRCPIANCLTETLLSRSYIEYKCRYCPGQKAASRAV